MYIRLFTRLLIRLFLRYFFVLPFELFSCLIIYLFRGKESPIIKYRSGERNFLESWGLSSLLE